MIRALLLAAGLVAAGCGDCGEPHRPEPPAPGSSKVQGSFVVAGHTYTDGTITVKEHTVELEATDEAGNVWKVTWERND